MELSPRIVFFSSATENTARFATKLGLPAERIPLYAKQSPLTVSYPHILITPTYGGGHGNDKGAVPKQVVKFLNDPTNRALTMAVVAAGNKNFGIHYAAAGTVISAKLNIPYLADFEMMGSPWEVESVRGIIFDNWMNLLHSQVMEHAA